MAANWGMVVADFVDDALEFVSRERAMLVRQLRRGAARTATSAGFAAASGALALSGYTAFSLAGAIYLSRMEPRRALWAGLFAMGAAAGLGTLAWRSFPRGLASETAEWVKHDMEAVKGAFI